MPNFVKRCPTHDVPDRCMPRTMICPPNDLVALLVIPAFVNRIQTVTPPHEFSSFAPDISLMTSEPLATIFNILPHESSNLMNDRAIKKYTLPRSSGDRLPGNVLRAESMIRYSRMRMTFSKKA